VTPTQPAAAPDLRLNAEAEAQAPVAPPTLLEALRALVARYELDGVPNDSRPAIEAASVALAAATPLNLQPGEHYAGAVLDAQGQHLHHLVLMPAAPEGELNWAAGTAWAESVGGVLPTRQEQALLFANCRQHLVADWHWSSEQAGASNAWCQSFYYGDQDSLHESAELRARAVRRV